MMRRPLTAVVWFWVLFGLFTAVPASDVLATITPCPKCPRSIMPALITVTAQLQPVSTCTPRRTCSNTHCQLEPSCSTFDWISTTIPCLGGATSTLITRTDQIVELRHVSTVLTSYAPCATPAPSLHGTLFNGTSFNGTSFNGTIPKNNKASCTSTTYQTMIVDISAPFNECGPLALANWDGSGLCKICVPDPDTKSQVVEVHKCLDKTCSDYAETWVSIKQTQTASSSTAVGFSSKCSASSGLNTIPVTATFSPSGDPAYTAPVTTAFSITTSVSNAQIIDVTTTVTITFCAESAPRIQTVVSGT